MATQPPDSSPFNPYLAPQAPSGEAAAYWVVPMPPTFAKVMFIIDLVLCSIRLLLVLIGIVGAVGLIEQNDPLAPTVLFELATGAGIVLFGIPGNILLLLRKPWAVALGWLALVSTVASLGVGVWQLEIILDRVPPGGPERAVAAVAAVVTVLARLFLIALYGAALWLFSSWAKRQTAAAQPWMSAP